MVTGLDENDRAKPPLAVAGFVIVDRLVGVDIDLQQQCLARGNRKRTAWIEFDLAVRRNLRVHGLEDRLAIGIDIDKLDVIDIHTQLRVRTGRHVVLEAQQFSAGFELT